MPNAQLVTIIFHTKIPAARKSLILVAREGIERPAYLAEFKDIFENAYKVTLSGTDPNAASGAAAISPAHRTQSSRGYGLARRDRHGARN